MIGDKLLKNNPLIIVDIGASGGIDPRWSKFTNHYKGILFEPDPREYKQLKSSASNNLLILDTALLDLKKEIDYYLCKKQELSSVFLPNTGLLEKFVDSARFEVIKKIRLNTDKLDTVIRKNKIKNIDFIKLDTQGSELSIIKGGTLSLKKTIGLQVEVCFVELYNNQPLFNEVDNYIRKMGFEIFDIKRNFWKRNNSGKFDNRKGQLIFGDALYFKAPEQILNIDGVDGNIVVHAICIYLVFGYVDLAEALYNAVKQDSLISKEVNETIKLILERFTKKRLFLNFRGIGIIKNMIRKNINLFNISGPYSGDDYSIGNSL